MQAIGFTLTAAGLGRIALVTCAIGLAGSISALSGLASTPAAAQTSTLQRNPNGTAPTGPSEISAQRRRSERGPTRLRVYPERQGFYPPHHRYLPPNAVRSCNAWYEQEYRPSGTVIVPRMRCRWVNG